MGKVNTLVPFLFSVFLPELIYKERVKRDLTYNDDHEVPAEVRFRALGREFYFKLEPADKTWTPMSHVLIRR